MLSFQSERRAGVVSRVGKAISDEEEASTMLLLI